MDKRIFFAALLLAGAPLQAQIGGATNDLLTAPIVQDLLEIRITGSSPTPGVQYRADDPQGSSGFKTLADGKVFVSPGEIDLAIPDFSPLRYAVTTSETLVPDENFRGIQSFLDALLGLGRTVFPAREEFAETQESVNRMTVMARGSRARAACMPLEDLNEAMERLKKGVVTQENLQSWIEGSTGLRGVRDTRSDIQAKLRDIADAIKARKEVLNKISEIKESPECGGFVEEVKKIETEFIQLSEDSPPLEALKASLEALDQGLAAFTEPTSWRGNPQTTWVFHKTAPSFQNGQELKIAIRRTALALGDQGVAVETEAEVSRKVTLRQYSRIVPEFSAAAIYSDVEYPKWGTEETEDGKMIVAPVKDDSANIEGAMMLNMILRRRDSSFVYPAFQLGISSAEDVPGLLVGVGLRFTQPTSWSLMFGGMLTWAKDLNELKEGDEVDGTADIESDLSLQRQDPALYVAFQYNF